MSSEERRAWIMAVVTVLAYGGYLAVVLIKAANTPITEVAYVSTMLWSIGAAIAVSIA